MSVGRAWLRWRTSEGQLGGAGQGDGALRSSHPRAMHATPSYSYFSVPSKKAVFFIGVELRRQLLLLLLYCNFGAYYYKKKRGFLHVSCKVRAAPRDVNQGQQEEKRYLMHRKRHPPVLLLPVCVLQCLLLCIRRKIAHPGPISKMNFSATGRMQPNAEPCVCLVVVVFTLNRFFYPTTSDQQ